MTVPKASSMFCQASHVSIQFSGTIHIRGINPYVLVSAAHATTLKADWKKPMPVRVQINGEPKIPWRINMMPTGKGSFYLYLHENVRNASHTKVGDDVQVNIAFDEEYRAGPTHEMPASLVLALQKNAVAEKSWNALSPSRKKEILRYLAQLKSAEAQERNITKVIHVLSGNESRFMARSWKDGK